MEIQKREDIKNDYKWDLKTFIKNEEELNNKCNKAKELLKELLEYKNKIMESSESLYNFLKLTDELSKLEDLLYVYASLKLDEDTTNTDNQILKEKIEKLLEESNEKTSFITPEILSTPYEKVKEYIKENSKLELYSFELEKTYRIKPYILDEEKETLISKVSNSLFNSSDIFYYLNNSDISLGTIEDEKGNKINLTNSNYSLYLESKNREVRKSSFEAMYNFWEKHKSTVSSIYKSKIKESAFTSEIRGYKSTLERALFPDQINKKVYTSLIESVHNNLKIFHDYQLLKKELLKLDELHMYDVYTPIIDVPDKKYTFEEAKQIILEALKPLGDEYINDLNKAFTEHWIDIYPNIGKRSGAYQWGCYGSSPRVLLNFVGELSSVSTTAHELGHAMHSYYSNKHQDYIYSSYPIFLAEIASTVNEVLLNDYMYKNATTENEKAYFLSELLELIKSTIFRQTMFAEFELIMHEKYQNKEPLTEKTMSDTYYELNKKYYGENVISDKEIRYEWERIPHFYTPFYVYKYATGLSCAIAASYGIINEKEGSLEKYLNFLKSGCSKDPLNILKDAGIDLENGTVVDDALKVFENKIKELKEIIRGK